MAFFNQILNDRGFIAPNGDMLAIYHQCRTSTLYAPSASPTKVTSASQASLALISRTKSRKLRAASSLAPTARLADPVVPGPLVPQNQWRTLCDPVLNF
jgi:hypothetical protein